MSLDDYLAATGHIELPPAERLRQLAIEVEPDFAANSPWGELKRIYALALRFEPEYAWLHASMGISCGVFAEHAEWDSDANKFERLTTEAEACFRRAEALDTEDDAHIRYAHGKLLMGVDKTRALALFDEAIALEPEHAWSRLYRAHCLHDLKRWLDAVAAYDAVPRDAFKGPVSWRMDLLVEQQAFCMWQAGDDEAARSGFQKILKRYEAQPHLAHWGRLSYLRAATGDAFPGLKPRVDALIEKIEGVPSPA